jgi:hypothetical protein
MSTNQVACPRCGVTRYLTDLQMAANATGNLMESDTICSDCNDPLGANLNFAQTLLLGLIARGGNAGVVVYGRSYAASVQVLNRLGMVFQRGWVKVASMGHTDDRPLWFLSEVGQMRIDLDRTRERAAIAKTRAVARDTTRDAKGELIALGALWIDSACGAVQVSGWYLNGMRLGATVAGSLAHARGYAEWAQTDRAAAAAEGGAR